MSANNSKHCHYIPFDFNVPSFDAPSRPTPSLKRRASAPVSPSCLPFDLDAPAPAPPTPPPPRPSPPPEPDRTQGGNLEDMELYLGRLIEKIDPETGEPYLTYRPAAANHFGICRQSQATRANY
ncbi:hypothetical protein KEM56_001699 [Ascosphaera pollenicola]|nr:hypothetical protein KEM56_001699 [Ascosphaera pollenicola]